MSRYNGTGTNPSTGNIVRVSWGWDEVPGFKPGYFFQVYSNEASDINKSGDGLLINEGFIVGISEARLKHLKKQWSVTKNQ